MLAEGTNMEEGMNPHEVRVCSLFEDLAQILLQTDKQLMG